VSDYDERSCLFELTMKDIALDVSPEGVGEIIDDLKTSWRTFARLGIAPATIAFLI